jgi:hypothetical protein
MGYIACMGRDGKFVQNFSWKTSREEDFGEA